MTPRNTPGWCFTRRFRPTTAAPTATMGDDVHADRRDQHFALRAPRVIVASSGESDGLRTPCPHTDRVIRTGLTALEAVERCELAPGLWCPFLVELKTGSFIGGDSSGWRIR
jgi:hypothetical protein